MDLKIVNFFLIPDPGAKKAPDPDNLKIRILQVAFSDSNPWRASRRSKGKKEKKKPHLLAASLMVLEDFIGLSGAETINLITTIKI